MTEPELLKLHEAVRPAIESAMATLTEREIAVLRMRSGMIGNAPMTLAQIAAEFNVTKERIRQIEAKALRKLRHPSRIKHLAGLLANTNNSHGDMDNDQHSTDKL